MIRAGTCFCHRCGNLFKEAYYKHGSKGVGVKLWYNKSIFGEMQWEIEPFYPDGKKKELEELPTLIKVKKSEEDAASKSVFFDSGVPDAVYCSFGSSREELELRRACPRCQNDTVLDIDCGRYNTFVVAVVGATFAGKSAWLQAIATSINLNAVNKKENGYPYVLSFFDKKDTVGILKVTGEDSVGESNYLRIIDRATNKIVANVLFLDAAGEHYENFNKEGNVRRKFVLGSGDYGGVDAVIYIKNVMLENAPRSGKESETRDKAFEVYNEMSKSGALRNKPVAYIYTNTDLLVRKKDAIKKVTDLSGMSTVALFTSATFKSETSYAPKDLLPRLVQEDIIAKAINTDVLCDVEINKKRGFMVQNCTSDILANGIRNNRYEDNFNVMDPLLWVLNALQIFPIM